MIFINPVEGTWLAINLFAAGVIFGNLADAWQGWRATVDGAGDATTPPVSPTLLRARLVQARANVRREAVLLYVVAALIVVIIPALGRPGDTPLTPYLVIIMSVAGGLALNSFLDRRTRRTIETLVAEGLVAELAA
jgi:hypothetical protein